MKKKMKKRKEKKRKIYSELLKKSQNLSQIQRNVN
jgi:hypothetical protein